MAKYIDLSYCKCLGVIFGFAFDSLPGGEAIRLGKWTDGEFKRLYDAVHFVTNTAEGESVFHGVNWKAVAQMVKTRTADMCREKW